VSIAEARHRLTNHQLHGELNAPEHARIFMEHDVFAVWASRSSYLDRYLAALADMGADRGPIHGFLERIAAGEDALDALESPEIPPTVRDFVTTTVRVADAANALDHDDPLRRLEAEYAAIDAIEARSRLWDGVVADIRRHEADRYLTHAAARV
jgi:hypothetical protein